MLSSEIFLKALRKSECGFGMTVVHLVVRAGGLAFSLVYLAVAVCVVFVCMYFDLDNEIFSKIIYYNYYFFK